MFRGYVIGLLVGWVITMGATFVNRHCSRPAQPVAVKAEGTIDEVGVWDRVLSESEIAALVPDTAARLAILYRGEVYEIEEIQLAPDDRTFLVQFRAVKVRKEEAR